MSDQRIDHLADLPQTSPKDLIEHILARYHERHRQQLPELISLAEKVQTAHAEHAQVPRGLSQHLRRMLRELDNHMLKEEQILFPMIANGAGAMARGPISVMLTEHEEHNESLQVLMTISHQLNLPVDTCSSWQKLYTGIGELKADLLEHIRLENEVLFAYALK
ncbi:MAG: hemerythrin domain-containing protein [Burkholderiaceae bacterium]|nr:hemerythrin domain-containing protein [Burkholderiaceae bacterium]MCD8515870.1 hemerythrin domain-containing protein [Burkholderiaceae bacterium]MCD8538109.1 hemerythrin domain-containing protein [Burkholderiaceae bacterium]